MKWCKSVVGKIVGATISLFHFYDVVCNTRKKEISTEASFWGSYVSYNSTLMYNRKTFLIRPNPLILCIHFISLMQLVHEQRQQHPLYSTLMKFIRINVEEKEKISLNMFPRTWGHKLIGIILQIELQGIIKVCWWKKIAR